MNPFSYLFLVACTICRVSLITSAPIPTRTGSEVSSKDVKNVLDFMQIYTPFEVKQKTAASSSGGDLGGREIADITHTPVFKETLSWLQESSGLERTGKLQLEDVEKLKAPRCGMADPPPPGSNLASYTEYSRWDNKLHRETGFYKLSYSFFPDTYPRYLRPDKDVEKGVLAAMCLWEWNSNVRFATDNGNGVKNADVRIEFGKARHGDGFDFDGPGGTLAHAFYPENGQLHFDSDEKWFLSLNNKRENNKKDIFTVSAHELGHTLGLGHSTTFKALMAPVYNFKMSFEEYLLPDDDVRGIANMYGNTKSTTNPQLEYNSACSRLHALDASRLKKPTFIPMSTNPTPSDRRTTTTRKTTTTTARKPIKEDTCRDDKGLQSGCDGWKRQGLCHDPNQGRSMSRVCRKTCGFCAETKPKRPNVTPTKAKTICDIKHFDSFFTIYDYSNTFHAYVIKDDFYFPVQVQILSPDPDVSLLDDTNTLGNQLRWRYDPKSVPAGVFKYSKTTLFGRSASIKATLWAPGFYFTFTDDGTVDKYERNGPHNLHKGNFRISELFVGYPHQRVDAAFVERDEKKRSVRIFNLFYGKEFWQFKTDDVNSNGGPRRFAMTSSGQDIEKWHGVPACGVDAVFAYNDVPYFLKNNVFWPATISKPLVYRDVSYHFFRCWDELPTDVTVSLDCSVAASISGHLLLILAATLLCIISLMQ